MRPGSAGLRECLVRYVALLALAGCGGDADVAAEPPGAADTLTPSLDTLAEGTGAVTDTHPLVDPAQPLAAAGDEGWMYSRTATADLDGDGKEERVVVMARAEVRNGRPLWDDGQPWQVYVEEGDGQRTHLYARYVQLGAVTMRVGLGEAPQRPSVVIVEHVPDRIGVYELEYGGPSRLETVHRYERMLDPRGETASPGLPSH